MWEGGEEVYGEDDSGDDEERERDAVERRGRRRHRGAIEFEIETDCVNEA